jgi:hypothetical protein
MPDHPPVPPIAYRPATAQDFGYCAKLYFAAMAATIRQLDLDMDAQVKNLRERWTASEVRIITRAGSMSAGCRLRPGRMRSSSVSCSSRHRTSARASAPT